jgi:hypothetical protein
MQEEAQPVADRLMPIGPARHGHWLDAVELIADLLALLPSEELR